MIDPKDTGAPGPQDERAADSEESAAPAPADPAAAHAEAPVDAGAADAADTAADSEDMSLFEAQLDDSDLAAALTKIAELEDALARAHADLYNLNQEYSNYVRRAKEAAPGHRDSGQSEVIEALIGVLDDIDAARSHGDLAEGPFAAIAQKLETTLETRFALERYGADGDDFDPAIHEALLANTNPGIDHPVVARILQPGYRRGDRIIRAAKVMVDNPE